MDEQVKARLIGATVLVVIAVLLVPELLSGRKHDDAGTAGNDGRATRTYTIDLGGAANSGSRLQPPSATAGDGGSDEPRAPTQLPAPDAGGDAKARLPSMPPRKTADDPESAGKGPAPGRTATVVSADPVPPLPTARVAKQEASTAPAPAPAVPKPAAKGKGGWAVQVGAFGSVGAARKVVADLERDGLPAYVAPLQKGGKTLHRVRVGPVSSKAEARQLAERVKARKLPAAVVAAD